MKRGLESLTLRHSGQRLVKPMKQIETHLPPFCRWPTPFGSVAVIWSVCKQEPTISRILLSKPGTSVTEALRRFCPNSRVSSCKEIDVLVNHIKAFLNGEDIRFSLDAVRLDRCSAFQQKVLRAEHAIPRGRVSAYKLIAKHVDNPNGAR
ncbi:MAG: methylated-DNA--[protein]-cysteine S-methyltransferase [Deltaproteobacteria bacterium]|nr:methylated-DNA--[protein]-cysteine S-methyltransferase [Deltaproteobacteria bacterium]